MQLIWWMDQCINSDLKLSKTTRSIRSITLTAMLLTVLVVQEYLLSGIPQIGLTAILIIVYARFLSYDKLIPLLVSYSFLDNWLMGSLSLLYFPTHVIIWLGFGLLMRRLRYKEDYVILIVATIVTFLMGFAYLPATIFVFHLDSWSKIFAYISADIIFDIALAANTVATFLLLYRPLTELLAFLFKRTFPNDYIDDEMSP